MFLINPVLAVVIDAAPGIPGDFNQNGVVDMADYVIWRSAVGTTYTQSDYDVWRAHFGLSVGATAAVNSMVPEPSLYIPTVIGLLAFCRYRIVRR